MAGMNGMRRYEDIPTTACPRCGKKVLEVSQVPGKRSACTLLLDTEPVAIGSWELIEVFSPVTGKFRWFAKPTGAANRERFISHTRTCPIGRRKRTAA